MKIIATRRSNGGGCYLTLLNGKVQLRKKCGLCAVLAPNGDARQ